MIYSNGLIVINSKCNISDVSKKSIQTIYDLGKYGVMYCKNKDDLNESLIDEDHVVIFGGDGTVFYVVQHVINRNIPIVHFPIGTGNGLVNSLLNINNFKVEKDLSITHQYIEKALSIGNEVLIDTMTIKMLNTEEIYHSFLFVSCGIFASLDINSEWLRMLGEIRFTIGAVLELVQYLTIGNSFNAILEFTDEYDHELKVEGNFVFFIASNLSHTSASSVTSPRSKHDDGYIYLSYILEPVSTWELLQILLKLEDGTYINKLNYLRTKKFKLTPKSNNNLFYDFDGEEFPIEPIEVSINPKSLRVII